MRFTHGDKVRVNSDGTVEEVRGRVGSVGQIYPNGTIDVWISGYTYPWRAKEKHLEFAENGLDVVLKFTPDRVVESLPEPPRPDPVNVIWLPCLQCDLENARVPHQRPKFNSATAELTWWEELSWNHHPKCDYIRENPPDLELLKVVSKGERE